MMQSLNLPETAFFRKEALKKFKANKKEFFRIFQPETKKEAISVL